MEDFLKQGRVEIPDGSDVYIKCQRCGTDIRYGRYCPECMMKIAKNIGQAMWSPDLGEKPHNKPDMAGRMHSIGREDVKHRRFGRQETTSKLDGNTKLHIRK